jgi:hypothetical protein
VLVVLTAYSTDLARPLCLDTDRRGQNTGQRGQQEAAAVHYSTT